MPRLARKAPDMGGTSEGNGTDPGQAKPGIRVTVSMPQQRFSRGPKLDWLRETLDKHPTDLFLTPQEFIGGHYCHRFENDDLHVDRSWLSDAVGRIASDYKTCIGLGACVRTRTTGASEDYGYWSSSGELLGWHSKFALPAYDDARADGHGNLWPETNWQRRATPIDIPELRLRIGTIFCWEVFSQTLWPAYSLAGVNLIVHPIKFAPRGWLKNKKLSDGKLHIVDFGNAPKSTIWTDRLLMASRHQVMCPIAVSCNSWNLGEKFMALVGMVDEMKKRTELFDVPALGVSEKIHTFEMTPEFYEGLDHHHSGGAFKAHTGSIDGFSEMGEWTMHGKIRRLESHLVGGTTLLDCQLKSAAQQRQKSSSLKRALGSGAQKLVK